MDTDNTEVSTDWMDDLDDSVFDDSTTAYTDSEGKEISADEFYEQGGTQLAELEDGFGEAVEDNTVDSNSKADTNDGTNENKTSANLNTNYFEQEINNSIKLDQMKEEQMQKMQEETQKKTEEAGKLAAANAASGNQLAYTGSEKDAMRMTNEQNERRMDELLEKHPEMGTKTVDENGKVSYRVNDDYNSVRDAEHERLNPISSEAATPNTNTNTNTNTNGVGGFFSSVGRGIANAASNVVEGARQVIDDPARALSNIGTDIANTARTAATGVSNLVTGRNINDNTWSDNLQRDYDEMKALTNLYNDTNQKIAEPNTTIPGISKSTEDQIIQRAEEDGISIAEAAGQLGVNSTAGIAELQSMVDAEAATPDSETTPTSSSETPSSETSSSETPSTTPSSETPATSTEEAEAEIATTAAATPTTPTTTEELDESEYIPEVPVDEPTPTDETTPAEEPVEEEAVEAGETTTPAETTPTDETIEEEGSEGSDSEETEETTKKDKGSVIWVPEDTPETIQWGEDGSCSVVNESVDGDKYRIDLPAEAGEAYDSYKAALNSGDEKAAKAAAEQLAAIVQGANRSDNNPVGWARNTGAKWESKGIVGKVGMVAGFLLKAGLAVAAPGASITGAITKATKNIINDAKDTQNILLVMGVDPKDIPGKLTTQIAYLSKNMNNREFLKAVENDMDDTGTEELSTEEAQSLATKMTKNGYDSRNTSATNVGDYNQGLTEEENKVVSDSSKKIIKYAPYVRIAVKKW